MRIHGYYRSGASWRVRIALGLKGLSPQQVHHHLRRGEQRAPAYLDLNPQGLVPTLELDGRVLTQSLAIIEWLDETFPDHPLLPGDPFDRARVRAFALAIAADTHPVQNLGVLDRLRSLGCDEDAVRGWAAETNRIGLAACERLVKRDGAGPFCFGAAPTLADLCLVPQLYNAERFGLDVDQFPRLLSCASACASHPAFVAAEPARQPDAEEDRLTRAATQKGFQEDGRRRRGHRGDPRRRDADDRRRDGGRHA